MKYILLLAVLLVGCGDRRIDERLTVCNCDQRDSLRAFLERTIGPANNKSDEEMEDVIRELMRSGAQTICSQKNVSRQWDGSNSYWQILTPLDSCEVVLW